MTDAPARAGYLPDILEEHLEELQFLLPLRDDALRSRDGNARHLADTDARILAHVDGVLAVGDRSLTQLEVLLSSGDPLAADAAAHALLALGTAPALDRLADAWNQGAPPVIAGIGSAVRRLGHPAFLSFLVSSLDAPDAMRRLLAARGHVRHGRWRPRAEEVEPALTATDAAVRLEAWRLARDAELAFEPRAYAAAMRDEDVHVRREGLLTAAWTSVPGALAVSRQEAQRPRRESSFPLLILAALGERRDLSTIAALVRHEELGTLRYELAGLYGAPSLVPDLLTGISDPDPRLAIAAGHAFTRVSGVDVTSGERRTFPREDADPNDPMAADFEDEGLLPDPVRAAEAWARLHGTFDRAQRVAGGQIVDQPAPWQALQALDFEARWWQLVRSRFWRATSLSLAEFERFPAPGAMGR